MQHKLCAKRIKRSISLTLALRCKSADVGCSCIDVYSVSIFLQIGCPHIASVKCADVIAKLLVIWPMFSIMFSGPQLQCTTSCLSTMPNMPRVRCHGNLLRLLTSKILCQLVAAVVCLLTGVARRLHLPLSYGPHQHIHAFLLGF